MTALEELAGYRVTLAAVKRDMKLCLEIAGEWEIKATAAMVAGDTEAEEFAQGSFQFWRECYRDSYEAHSMLLECIRKMERQLTHG